VTKAAGPRPPGLYRNNDLDDGGGSIDTEMDGLTDVLTCQASVNAGATNTVKLAIADASDQQFDSVVFIGAGGVTTQPPPSGSLPVPALGRYGPGALVLLLGSTGALTVSPRGCP